MLTLRTCCFAALAVFTVAACDLVDEIEDGLDRRPGESNGPAPADDDGAIDDGAIDDGYTDDGSTDDGDDPFDPGVYDPPAPAPEPAPEPPDLSVDLDVQLRTLLINGGGGFFIEANFAWSAAGSADVRVDIQFKRAYGEWVAILSGLPASDVQALDMSQHAGPTSSWHFRAVAYDPAFPGHDAKSAITTINNY